MKQNAFLFLTKSRIKVLIVSILIGVLYFFYSIFSDLYKNKTLEIVFLDIGQGDSILIKGVNGENMIIDTGSNYITNQKVQKELPFLNKEIDSILLTHPDKDHVGGTEDLLRTNTVKDIITSTENDYQKYPYKTTVSSINDKFKINFSGLEMYTLNPEIGQMGGDNGRSLVNTLKYGNFNFIFTGDADSETERNLVSKGYFDINNENKNIKNILKVGHHGSDTSSSEIFLKKIKPEYCVVSVSKDNNYGHPSKKALERLEKYCKNIFRTDLNGSISLKTNGKDIVYVLEK